MHPVIKGAVGLCVLSVIVGVLAAPPENACVRSSELDPAYCDNNHDLVADTPTDPSRQRNPDRLIFSFSAVEDPGLYESLLRPFADALTRCTAKPVVFFRVHSNAAQIEAMRAGRLHVSGFAPGATTHAVSTAGAVPFAGMGTAAGMQGYHMIVLVRRDSAARKLSDLKGKRVVHTSPSSNSGHMAALALFPREGLVPDSDYKIGFSGRHEHSVRALKAGEYDAAVVSSGVYAEMLQRGDVKDEEFRVIYRSPLFPTSSVVHAHDLAPALRDRIVRCVLDFRFTGDMSRAFEGADRFVPINYLRDYAVVRDMAGAGGKRASQPPAGQGASAPRH